MRKIDLGLVQQYIDDGYISKQFNHDKKLIILNYTDKCTYESKWDDITKICRGLIVNLNGEIIAKCMPKFFNLFEKEESMPKNLPNGPFETYSKEDGSMTISYFYDGEVKIATRGSFYSDQSKWANNYIKTNHISGFNPIYTYIFECIYKGNRIVTDYGNFEGLILLTVFDLNECHELTREEVERESKIIGIPVVECHEFKDINDILDEVDSWNNLDEGFVVKFHNGFRIKIKSKKYLEIAKTLKGINLLYLWKNMKDGEVDKNILQQIPEEFRKCVDPDVEMLQFQYNKILNKYKKITKNIPRFNTRKETVEYLKTNYKKELSPLIKLIYNEDIDGIIMKLIKPKSNLLQDL